MQNKKLINKIKNNAELAQAAYGYYDLIGKKFRDRQDEQGNALVITLHDILDSTYKGYKTPNHKLGNPEELDGDMTPTQAKRFFEKYDVLIHQPNTKSGFSATLFGEKRKQTNTESKEVSYTAEYGYTNYILSFRGTDNKKDLLADKDLALGNLPKKQYFDMLLFYYQCIGKIPFYVDSTSMPQDKDSLEYKLWKKLYQRNTESESKYKPYITQSLLQDSNLPPTSSNFTPPIDSTTKLTLTGHSLGGCLAQMFALSFANYVKRDCGIINEVYHTESKVA